jgi:hypothetical protein
VSRKPTPLDIRVDKKQLEDVEYSSYFGSITNLARYTRKIKSRIKMAKVAFSRKKSLFTSKYYLNLRKKLGRCYIWSTALCGAETGTLRKLDQKYPESGTGEGWRKSFGPIV